ncbi:MAG: cation diffusion facilitator family transporter [Candidatus Thermoplasmatota archaeon]|nr:cation diffusion facilitator family transporter [Candidatus Thermoplasmatota archaeon]MCL5254279.1 cation diffusion facilitator family transporter [Candidatus Thermoplasmatota archaeon]
MNKLSASRLSAVSNGALSAAKIIIGLITGSVAVLSDGIHSFTDVTASVSTAVSVKKASMPADTIHKFGHGKFENVSGVFESILLIATSVIIVAEAFDRVVAGEHIVFLGIAIITMIISAAVDFAVSIPVRRASRREESIALKVDNAHLTTDGLASVGVVLALIAVYLTGNVLFDIIVAFIIAAVMSYSGISLLLESGGPLVDVKISDADEQTVIGILSEHKEICRFHSLRTRKSGNIRFIDLHLTFKPNTTVYEAHSVVDAIETRLRERIPNCSALIHIEPEGVECADSIGDDTLNRRKGPNS